MDFCYINLPEIYLDLIRIHPTCHKSPEIVE